MIFLTRRATFSASHYYWNEAWTAEKNEQVFGRCCIGADAVHLTGLRR